MRIESTDANTRLIEHAVGRTSAVNANTSQKMNTFPPESNDIKESAPMIASEKMIIDSIGKANKVMTVANRSLEFSIHEATKDIMVKVINTETKEVIREIPPEKILNMVAGLMELAGLLIDERR
jgi:flagellar protein FlaG